MRYLKKSNLESQKVKEWLPGGQARGEWEIIFNGYIISVLQDKRVLEMKHGNGGTTV